MAEAVERFGEGIRFYISPAPNTMPQRRPEDTEHLIDGLCKAGIIEQQPTDESH
jgi:hypothetical protein